MKGGTTAVLSKCDLEKVDDAEEEQLSEKKEAAPTSLLRGQLLLGTAVSFPVQSSFRLMSPPLLGNERGEGEEENWCGG